MAQLPLSPDELAAELAALEERTQSGQAAGASDDTLANLKAELETFVTELRRRPDENAYESEPGCTRVTDMVKAIGRDPQPDADHTTGDAASDLTSPTNETPLGNFGAYELLSKVGEGGMGAVYKARHTRLDKIVAIKLLPAERMKDQGAVARFQREMRAVGKLEHPNIVRAMDAGEVDGTHFLVMEYVKGVDLSELVKRRGPLPVADACELIRQAAVGLDEADEHGMVHRDIKPSNLMLCVVSRRKPPVVKILDMGLALLSEAHSPEAQGLTTTGQMMGTLDYMAPEQGGDSKSVDIRADIYALGASLYKLLCGEVIYFGEKYQTPVQKMMALATQPPPPIQKRRQGVPKELAAVLHRMLEKNPDKRFATPEEVADALVPFCAGADLSALISSAGFDVAPAKDTSLSATEPSYSQPDVDTGVSAAPRAKPPVSGNTDLSLAKPPAAKIPPPKSPTSPQRVAERSVAPPVKSAAPVPHIQTQPSPAASLARRRGRGKLPPWLPLAIGGGLLGFGGIVALAAALIFFFQTPNGTLRVEINDPDIEVKVKGEDIVLTNADKEPIKLKAGEHTLIVTRGDFEFGTKQFVLKKGETSTVKVELLSGKVQVVQGDEVLGSRNLPPAASDPLPQTVAVAGLEFDGNDDCVDIPSLRYDGSHPLTVEAWCKVEGKNIARRQFVMSDYEGGGFALAAVGDADTQQLHWVFTVGKPNLNRALCKEPIPEGWTHVAGVLAGTSARLYVNGRLAARLDDLDADYKRSLVSLCIGANPGLDAEGKQYFGDTFHGQISTVRLSKVARYDQDFTPAASFKPDDETLALYHFDEGQGDVLKDSSGNNHHGKIVGAKWTTNDERYSSATNGDFALEFDGKSDYVDVEFDEEVNIGAYTVEAKVSLGEDDHGTVVTCRGLGTLYFNTKRWIFIDNDGRQQGVAGSREEVHLAVVVRDGRLQFFVNGRLQADSVTSNGEFHMQGIRIGNVYHKKDYLGATIDEVRVSTIARYNSDFAPQTRFEPDKHTLALYHFDEGSGDVLKDSSGNNRHGKIVGAKWVKVDSTPSREPLEGSGVGELKVSELAVFRHPDEVRYAIISPNEDWIVASDKSNSVRLYNLRTLKLHHTFVTKDDKSRRAVFSPTGETIALWSSDGGVQVFSCATGESVGAEGLVVREGSQLHLLNDRLFFGVSKSGRCILRDFRTGEISHELGADEPVHGVLGFDAKSSRLAWYDGQSVFVCQAQERQPNATFEFRDELRQLNFTRGGARLHARGKWKNTLWDLSTKESIDGQGGVVSPDGHWTANVSGNDPVVFVKHLDSQQSHEIKASHVKVHALAFSPHGRVLATGDHRGAIRLWETATGRDLSSPQGHGGWINRLQFSASGRLLVSCSWDKTVRVQRIETVPRRVDAGTISVGDISDKRDLNIIEPTAARPPASRDPAAPPPAIAPFDAAQAKAHQAAWAKYLGEPVEITNSVGIKLTLIPPGKFKMGEDDSYHRMVAVPVTLSKPFRFGVHEVTQGEWKAILGTEPWKKYSNIPTGDKFPASFVTWDEAVEFCQKLTAKEREGGRIQNDQAYRLPTEAEFEYALRAGTTTERFFGKEDPSEYAWCNAGKPPQEVGLKKPNPWGLYDIHGNASEWCQDFFGTLTGGTDPQGPTTGTKRCNRGGSVGTANNFVNSWWRYSLPPEGRKANYATGLRVVLQSAVRQGAPPATAVKSNTTSE